MIIRHKANLDAQKRCFEKNFTHDSWGTTQIPKNALLSTDASIYSMSVKKGVDGEKKNVSIESVWLY